MGRVTTRGAAGQQALEHEGVRTVIANLMTFPFVRERAEAGTLAIHAAVFAIADGKLRVLGEDGTFAPAASSKVTPGSH